MSNDSFQVIPFSRERQLVVDGMTVGARRHIVHGLVEIDVTKARQLFRDHKGRTGETLSFTAFIVACLAHAIDSHKSVQAYRDWRNRLIIFDDVDVVVDIETQKDHVAVPHIIRSANRKTFRQIHDEIRQVQSQGASIEQSGTLMRLGLYVPGFVRRLFFSIWMKNPRWLKQAGGTVVVSAIGMFGRGGGWGFGIMPIHNLGLLIGGIAEKPGVIDGRIEIREYLDLTVSVDHDVVDGAPAARFARELVVAIESGYGLD
jgi:pyruvate/2-oxoglutarate dehydrogenase complex dihydrolipoamide acyltransferase (E2) component